MKKNKKRIIFVISFLVVFAIYLFITIRGDYLQTLSIGEKYVAVFNQNLKYKTIVTIVNFIFLFISTYLTTVFIKKGLKKFFEEDKKEMTKLPNKSISLVIGLIVSMFTSNILTEKVMLAFNSSYFGITDPVFNIDIGYYFFQKPFIEFAILYFIAVVVGLSVYIALYYIIAFNVYFEKGINIETLKKNTFIKQLIGNLITVSIGLAIFNFIKIQDIIFGKFLSLSDGTDIYGAGLTDVIIKMWGYIGFSIIIVLCTLMVIKYLKLKRTKKIFIWISIIPSYLVTMFILIIGFNLLYVKPNELDKQKAYIKYNIEYTKNAYGINAEEITLQSSGTITDEDIASNQDVINNINLLNNTATLAALTERQTSLGYYSFDTTKASIYNVDGTNSLVYVSPREIVSNDTRTYNNKTYEYTHGFGAIITSATKTDEVGNITYIQSEFSDINNKIKITEPRIYFGLKTNEAIITSAKDKTEFDYPITSSTSSTNNYNGTAGINLNFIDRLILGIKEGNLGIAFSGNITKDSKIITDRNIIKRAETVMPYLTYDENPYLVITDSGKLVWVIDAYTISDNYPYSQESNVIINNSTKKINYIRNSVKVLVDAYNGTMEFYITDRTDPIVMAYRNLYPSLFEDLDKELPSDIQKHITYSEFLYGVQSNILERYHDVQPEVLYRADDVWSIAQENTSKVTTVSGTEIKPYYTVIKPANSETKLGLVLPYTGLNKQNLTSYLVGTYDFENKATLKIYKFATNNTILGTIQLDTLIEQDEKISAELEALNVIGTKTTKNIIVVPINNTLLYIEPIYQVLINESQVPTLKKIIVASGNKIAIGNNLKDALTNLLSQKAVSIEVQTDNADELILQIINANKNLEASNSSNDWEMIGKDITKLQELINQLEVLTESKTENAINNTTNTIVNTNII